MKNKLDKSYKELVQKILDDGVDKKDRTGTGTVSIFGEMISHDMRTGFPLLTSKQVYYKSIIVELLWFLGKHMQDPKYAFLGHTNIRYLLDNNCLIWVGDAYKKYLKACENNPIDKMSYWMQSNPDRTFTPHSKEKFIDLVKHMDTFAQQWGSLGPIYGKQWTCWDTKQTTVIGHNGTHNQYGTIVINQIQEINDQLELNPDSRRILVNAWNVAELEQMTLPPCHYGFQLYTAELSLEERVNLASKQDLFDPFEFGVGEESTAAHCHNICDSYGVPKRSISLMWNQRSVDTLLGLPFNIASYGLLLSMLGKIHNMVPYQLKGSLGDVHIYNDQLPFVEKQLDNEIYNLPTLKIVDGDYKKLTDFDIDSFIIEDYQHAGKVNYPLSN